MSFKYALDHEGDLDMGPRNPRGIDKCLERSLVKKEDLGSNLAFPCLFILFLFWALGR